MTTVTVTSEVPPRSKREDDSVLYGSTSAYITEETEYVRKIRTTLEKIRSHMFTDEQGHGNASHKLDAEVRSGTIQNGSDSAIDPTSLDLLLENMRRKDQQLLEMNKENEVLQIKLEASREAGAAALRNVAQRLFENYQTQSEDLKKKHENSKHLLQINNLEKEQALKQQTESLSQLSEKLEAKHVQIIGLENRVQRMENEKKTLLERKSCLERKLLQLGPNAAHSKSCRHLQSEISILQEQICHLQFVIHSQHQHLHSIIQEMEGLKNTLKEQDKKIENLKEKVDTLEAQNKELKTKVAHWTETPRTSVSKAVSTSELKTDGASPYLMLIRLRK
ncbi:coiled-coil domain-containing protein 68 isoform X1 [Psammomys obesus]|uniref:coiled-coil domain-containing protein 68 isoform X1 n=1 Tax=Psammomys obesus TaxID=48139 RepID=UPI00245287F7|nr:coiled-coil domain-containing protein 68 isoform X1 [Psammomys obesus]XP_055478949.1 coiled-coil domain-containing protein 68 isoform X1 [Psammomys obesus]XP_055478950.1 coiled-coil domain-containing protein 68 isoform X1 [Psammomys obesus]XP_055478951.1 coiled-coil domain-containing protein 68 isoform X1 [Psammomys obesus]XP_055478952.1 coiled-coil domain-containing protein 68 isoform X1 [Psammomys obesus]